MSTELDVIRYAEMQAEVVSLYARAYKIVDIVKKTQLSKTVVEQMLAEYREYALQDRSIREKAREAILTTREHYDDIIRQMYDAVEQADLNDDYKARMSGLKAIGDLENQRISFMQKAGMLVENEIGEQIAETERKQKILIDILKTIARKHPAVGAEIQSMLSEVTGQVEGVVAERTDR